jgi:hypothetical protein
MVYSEPFKRKLILDIIKSLVLEKTIDKKKIKPIEDLRKKWNSKILVVIKHYLMTVSEKLRDNSFDFLIKYFESTAKSQQSDANNKLKQLIKEALQDGLSQDILDSTVDMVPQLTTLLGSSNKLTNINYKLVNQKAVEFLQNDMDNNFSTLDSDAADGIFATVAESMAADSGYSISSIVENIISSAFNPSDDGKMYFPSRTMDVSDWANMVALNTTSNAAVASLKSIADDAGLETYQFVCNNGACDECDEYDNEIYNFGDGPEPPIHPNCECVSILVPAEIAASVESDEDNSE